MSLSIPKKIEHWVKIGRMAEEIPDLSYNVMKEILTGFADVKAGNLEEYKPGSL